MCQCTPAKFTVNRVPLIAQIPVQKLDSKWNQILKHLTGDDKQLTKYKNMLNSSQSDMEIQTTPGHYCWLLHRQRFKIFLVNNFEYSIGRQACLHIVDRGINWIFCDTIVTIFKDCLCFLQRFQEVLWLYFTLKYNLENKFLKISENHVQPNLFPPCSPKTFLTFFSPCIIISKFDRFHHYRPLPPVH